MIPADNPTSWQAVLEGIREYPDNDQWREWKIVAERFICDGIALGLDNHFRAGNSMHHFLFSTRDDHRLGHDPRVTIAFCDDDQIRVAYGTKNLHFASPELLYQLHYEGGFSTFRRFLNQLWTATKPEPIPSALRAPEAAFDAPILTPAED
jgi:hypothetical protein